MANSRCVLGYKQTTEVPLSVFEMIKDLRLCEKTHATTENAWELKHNRQELIVIAIGTYACLEKRK